MVSGGEIPRLRCASLGMTCCHRKGEGGVDGPAQGVYFLGSGVGIGFSGGEYAVILGGNGAGGARVGA